MCISLQEIYEQCFKTKAKKDQKFRERPFPAPSILCNSKKPNSNMVNSFFFDDAHFIKTACQKSQG